MGKDTEDRKMCLSFTLGCILHYCGDLYGHDFVNTFSGGAFPSFFSTEIFNIKGERLNNILSHLSVESYMDDIVYPTYDADRDGGIDGPNNFIAGAMVFDGSPAIGLIPLYGGYPATITEKLDEIKEAVSDIWIVGGLLENMVEDLFNEDGNNVPPHYTAFLNLRNFLTSTADEYIPPSGEQLRGTTWSADENFPYNQYYRIAFHENKADIYWKTDDGEEHEYLNATYSLEVVGGVSILTLDLGEFAGVHRYNLLMDSDGSMLYIAVDSTKGTITHTDEKQYRFLYQDVSSDQ
jgi:hypothetical protein